eukprot:990054-Prorocentrum_minimum.AAC.1
MGSVRLRVSDVRGGDSTGWGAGFTPAGGDSTGRGSGFTPAGGDSTGRGVGFTPARPSAPAAQTRPRPGTRGRGPRSKSISTRSGAPPPPAIAGPGLRRGSGGGLEGIYRSSLDA